MARAHEQARLRKPRHRATQMGTVHREHREFLNLRVGRSGCDSSLVADEDIGLGHDAVPRCLDWVVERGDAGFASWKFAHRAKIDPQCLLFRRRKIKPTKGRPTTAAAIAPAAYVSQWKNVRRGGWAVGGSSSGFCAGGLSIGARLPFECVRCAYRRFGRLGGVAGRGRCFAQARNRATRSEMSRELRGLKSLGRCSAWRNWASSNRCVR